MTFQINGVNGKYDGLIRNDSVRYGRNAVENHARYLETPIVNGTFSPAPILDFSPTEDADTKNAIVLNGFIEDNEKYLKSLPPLEYEYRYMPQGGFDGLSLMGAAYEEMGTKELSVDEFEDRYLINDDTMTAEPLDINNDGKIDLGEYSTTILAADVLSKGVTDPTKVDGTITPKGMNALLEYNNKANVAAASKLYSNIYNNYSLNDYYEAFNADGNNALK